MSIYSDLRSILEDGAFSGGTDDQVNFVLSMKDMTDDEQREYIKDNKSWLENNARWMLEEKSVSDVLRKNKVEPNYQAAFKDYIGENEDIVDKWTSLDTKTLLDVAKENNIDFRDMLNDLRDQKIAKDRKAIAHGEDLGGWFDSPSSFGHNLVGALQTVFTPRTQEAIERGEEPSVKDYALDIGENAISSIPVGGLTGKAARVIKPLNKAISKNKVTENLASLGFNVADNALVPLTTEVADAIAYGNGNARDEFRLGDVVGGTAINFGIPRVISQGSKSFRRLFGDNDAANNVFKYLENAGQAKNLDQVNADFDRYKKEVFQNKDNPAISSTERNTAKAVSSRLSKDQLADLRAIEKVKELEDAIENINGSTPSEYHRLVNYLGDGYYDIGGTLLKKSDDGEAEVISRGVLSLRGKPGNNLEEKVQSYANELKLPDGRYTARTNELGGIQFERELTPRDPMEGKIQDAQYKSTPKKDGKQIKINKDLIDEYDEYDGYLAEIGFSPREALELNGITSLATNKMGSTGLAELIPMGVGEWVKKRNEETEKELQKKAQEDKRKKLSNSAKEKAKIANFERELEFDPELIRQWEAGFVPNGYNELYEFWKTRRNK